LAKRVTVNDEKPWQPSCATAKCSPLWAVRVNTNEGPVFFELGPNNTVLISHSFDEPTAGLLRQTVLLRTQPARTTAQAVDLTGRELTLRLQELPLFQAYQAEFGRELFANLAAMAP
jgi:hypothetical protein